MYAAGLGFLIRHGRGLRVSGFGILDEGIQMETPSFGARIGYGNGQSLLWR